MLANLPVSVCCVLLMVVGAVISAAINWAIYSWSVFSRRPISPWMGLLEEEQETLGDRTWLDKIPVYGWIRLRRHHEKAWTWIRPMLIDVVWIVGLPWFWHWQLGGGLLGFHSGNLPAIAQWSSYAEVWFWAHTLLIALLFIATFIDFDERLIPDQITIPGTIAGLCIAAALPSSRLPVIAAGAAGTTVEWISFRSPHPFPAVHWCFSWEGLALALGVFTIWILALFPRISPFHLGIGKGIKFTLAWPFWVIKNSGCAPSRWTAAVGVGVDDVAGGELDQPDGSCDWNGGGRRFDLGDSIGRWRGDGHAGDGIWRCDVDGNDRDFHWLAGVGVWVYVWDYCCGGLRDGVVGYFPRQLSCLWPLPRIRSRAVSFQMASNLDCRAKASFRVWATVVISAAGVSGVDGGSATTGAQAESDDAGR